MRAFQCDLYHSEDRSMCGADGLNCKQHLRGREYMESLTAAVSANRYWLPMYEQAKVATTVTKKLNMVTTTALTDRTGERGNKFRRRSLSMTCIYTIQPLFSGFCSKICKRAHTLHTKLRQCPTAVDFLRTDHYRQITTTLSSSSAIYDIETPKIRHLSFTWALTLRVILLYSSLASLALIFSRRATSSGFWSQEGKATVSPQSCSLVSVLNR